MNAVVPKTILVATDYSEPATAAMRAAVAVATAADAEIVVVHAETFGRPADPGTERQLAREQLELYAAELIPARINHLLDLVEKPAVKAIVDVTESSGADLVFVGTHGRHSAARLILGSVASGVIRASNVPVITVPQDAGERMRSVLCAVDFSDDSRAALEQARMLTSLMHAELTVLHIVVPGSATEDYAAKALDAWLPAPDRSEPRISCAILRGEPESIIVDMGRSDEYDIIVLGSQGPLALTVARNAQCAVLTAHAVPVGEPA